MIGIAMPRLSESAKRKLRTFIHWSNIVVFIVFVGVPLYCYAVSFIPLRHVDIPRNSLPVPNGYDDFVAAGKMAKGGEVVDDMLAIPPRPAKHSNKDIAAAVLANEPVLNRVRLGLSRTCVVPSLRLAPFSEHDIESLHEASTAKYTLCFLAIAAETQGDNDSASQIFLNGVRFGALVSNGADTNYEVRNGVGAIRQDCHRLQPLIAKMPLKLALSCASSLTESEMLVAPFSDGIAQDKWEAVWEQEALSRSRMGSEAWLGTLVDPGAKASDKLAGVVYLLGDKNLLLDRTIAEYDRGTAVAHKPYQVAEKVMRVNPPQFMGGMPDYYGQMLFWSTASVATIRLTELQLAMQAYHCDHRAYPPTLAVLAPKYLPRIPDDPFAVSGTFRYRLSGKSYVLYSVGPDGRDDGGKPLSRLTDRGEISYGVHDAKQMGDMVAGVNY